MTHPLVSDHMPFPGYIVDASVGIKLFIDDPLSDTVHQLFENVTNDPPIELHVPDLFFIECTNILWKYVRWGNLPIQNAQINLKELSLLLLQATPTLTLMDAALQLAIEYSITAYDACYLALSARQGFPLITADKKLADTIDGVILLSNFSLP